MMLWNVKIILYIYVVIVYYFGFIIFEFKIFKICQNFFNVDLKYQEEINGCKKCKDWGKIIVFN